MKYDYGYDWLLGDQPKINKEVIKFLFQRIDYQGVSFKVDSVEDDFPRLVDAIEDEIDDLKEKRAVRAEAALKRLGEVDYVLTASPLENELWISFVKRPSGPVKAFTKVIVVKVALEKAGARVPLSARISYAR